MCIFFSHPPSCFVSEPRDDGDDADADDGIVVNFNRVTFRCELNAVDAVGGASCTAGHTWVAYFVQGACSGELIAGTLVFTVLHYDKWFLTTVRMCENR